MIRALIRALFAAAISIFIIAAMAFMFFTVIYATHTTFGTH